MTERLGIPTGRLVMAVLGIHAVIAVVIVILATGTFSAGEDSAGGSAGSPAAAPVAAGAAGLKADRFDSGRAWAELRRQVEMGPRPAGSPASRALAERIRRALPRGRFEDVPGGLRNVVGTLPGRRPAVVLAAHYDTKDLPGFVGANDGASGTAALMELARGLRKVKRSRRARELRFVFFDGEESPDDSKPFYSTGLRGSRAYAARHRAEVHSLILLDYVGEKGLRIPREQGSDPRLWGRLRSAAKRVGALETFPDATVGQVLDDHTPFTRLGIPAIDLIDFDFACFHKPCDDLSVVSEDSLDRVGETVFELVSPARRR